MAPKDKELDQHRIKDISELAWDNLRAKIDNERIERAVRTSISTDINSETVRVIIEIVKKIVTDANHEMTKELNDRLETYNIAIDMLKKATFIKKDGHLVSLKSMVLQMIRDKNLILKTVITIFSILTSIMAVVAFFAAR